MASTLSPSAMNSILVDVASIPSELTQEEFLSMVAEVIHTYITVYFVGFFILDSESGWAVFHSGTPGEFTDTFLQQGFRLLVKYPQNWMDWMGNIFHNQKIYCVGAETLIYSLPTEWRQSPNVASGREEMPPLWGGPLLPETRWELYLPLRAGSEVKGVLWINRSTISRFELEDIIHFQLLADQLSTRLWSQQSGDVSGDARLEPSNPTTG